MQVVSHYVGVRSVCGQSVVSVCFSTAEGVESQRPVREVSDLARSAVKRYV